MTQASDDLLALRLLSYSAVDDHLSKLFPDAPVPLDALAQALTVDRFRAVRYRNLQGGKENYVLSTPRLRVKFFEDRADARVAMLLSVESNGALRWEADRRKGQPCTARWTTQNLAPAQKLSAGMMPRPEAARFWEFWQALLAKEQESLEELKTHPGWAYRARRHGLHGGVEFQVYDRDEILQQCGNTFLIEQNSSEERGRPLRFEVQRSEAAAWIAGQCAEAADLAKVPIDGVIRLDYTGLGAEIKRKRTALERLRGGGAAMRELAGMLPNGPFVSALPMAFCSQLLSGYNEEQLRAVAKALVPGSLTCILGPPGTGKTSVIAEIAAQLTASGKRVLVSSQANLAVDNALERLAGIESIFAVRLGRPESVKLNPELLLDNASARYQDRLLSRSRTAEALVEAELAPVKDSLPSPETLYTWTKLWRNRVKQLAVIEDAKGKASFRKDEDAASVLALRAAENELLALTHKNDVDLAQLEDFHAAARALLGVDVDLAQAHAKREEIPRILRKQEGICRFAMLAVERRGIAERAEAATRQVDLTRRDIDAATNLYALLLKARHEMAAHTHKKAGSGFFKGIWLELTGPSHDLIRMGDEYGKANLLANQARMALPGLLLQQVQATEIVTGIDHRLFTLGKELGNLEIRFLQNQIDAQAEKWSADLELALKIGRAGALRWLHALGAHREIEQAGGLLKKCTSARRASAQTLGRANENARKQVKALVDCEDTAPRLLTLAQQLGTRIPEGFPHGSTDENEEFLSTLADRRNAFAERLERQSGIQAALVRYRARLEHAVVDLRRVVLLEASVVGATCSGIAGAQEFDGDFDCVILDEAGRTTALDILMPMVRGRSIVLVGDHKQLPPFIGQATRKDLDKDDLRLAEKSIFEQVFETAHADRVEVLRKQYRMAPPICDIVGRISYPEPQLRIETAGAALQRGWDLAGMRAVHWICPAGPANTAKSDPGGGLLNEAEIAAAVATLERIAKAVPARSAGQEPFSIGVIAMYRRQAQALERKLAPFRKTYPDLNLEIGTVDSFQGREKDAVLVSFGETDPSRKRFFYDRRKLNVALSRARDLLVLIGSLDTLGAAQRCFGEINPLFELRALLDAGQGVSTSRETFHA